MLDLSSWPYIQQTSLTSSLLIDTTELLLTNKKRSISEHCISVAKTSKDLAKRFNLDTTIAYTSALLHDISSVIRPQDMLNYALQNAWEIDDAEKKHPFLLHQRLSSEIARDVFNISDRIILSSIGCHSTLKRNPTDYDMLLFLADKLSWDQPGTPPFYDFIMSALSQSLTCASLTYIEYAFQNGMILTPHKWLIEAT